VEKVADKLRSQGVRVFYDQYEQVQLWGRDLYQHFDDVYQDAARYCVLFASKRYAEKVWTNHELRSAQARAIRENKEYILPAHFDNIEVRLLSGMRSVGFLAFVRDSVGGHDEYLGEAKDVTLQWYCSLKDGGNLTKRCEAREGIASASSGRGHARAQRRVTCLSPAA